MGIVRIETFVQAPPQRCFDLARSADFHVASTKHTSEKIVGGVTSGLMGLGDLVEFEAYHFGVKQRLCAKIVSFDPPNHFRDTQVRGIFRSFDHDHYFSEAPGGTLMKDIFEFECPFGMIGKMVDPLVARHLRSFLTSRALEIKRAAESEEWRSFI